MQPAGSPCKAAYEQAERSVTEVSEDPRLQQSRNRYDNGEGTARPTAGDRGGSGVLLLWLPCCGGTGRSVSIFRRIAMIFPNIPSPTRGNRLVTILRNQHFEHFGCLNFQALVYATAGRRVVL